MAVAIGLLVLMALYLFLIAPCRRRPDDSRLRGWLYAHRGLHDGNRAVPENSLEAFRLAVESGYGMELDVQLTRDGRLVVHHDGSLRRVCGVDRLIRETDYAGLPALPDGSRIPLLEEVLRLVDGRAPIIVEVKHYGGAARVAKATLETLQGYEGAYCVESFDPTAMAYFRKHAPHILRGQLASGDKWDRDALNLPSYIALRSLLVNVLSRPHFIAYSYPADYTVSMWLMKHLFHPLLACWTVRKQQVLDSAAEQGYQYPIFELFKPRS
ncbi:MAG: glycerophosphodiester phosphodiesterase family protein [Clostridia bacterium]|nr:glycerophosphodiester phosphodiesterase family protein [Clostridia bacterium]